MANPTVRSLARKLSLSRTTISDALRGSPRVNAETARQIREAAVAAGYRPNPLASAVMSELRRSRGGMFRGVLAMIMLDEPDRPAHAAKFFDQLIGGARDRAEALGFRMEKFVLGDGHLQIHRLDTILQSRGIQGLLLLPAWDDPDFSKLDWSRYAGVYTDYIIEHPALHSVCSDHYRSMTGVLQRLHERGYRRPGLFLQKHHDERLQHRWEGAFLAFQQYAEDLARVPPLVRNEVSRDDFVAWFRQHDPDVVLGHHSAALDWMRACGARVPSTHGFFCLNVLMQHTPCAGLDLQPRLLGARAAEMVIGQLSRNELGIPDHFSLTAIPAEWVDGPTIRAAAVPAGNEPLPRRRATADNSAAAGR